MKRSASAQRNVNTRAFLYSSSINYFTSADHQLQHSLQLQQLSLVDILYIVNNEHVNKNIPVTLVPALVQRSRTIPYTALYSFEAISK